MAKLGDVATYINGYSFKPSDWSENGLPIIRIQDLTGNAYETNRYDGTYDTKYEVNEGDILISWSASLGVYKWSRGKALLNQHIFKVVFDKVDINPSFFTHQVEEILKKYALQAHGSTMKHLTKPVFDALPFYLPSREKQDWIASQLDRISELSEYHKQQLIKLEELVKSQFIGMFGDPFLGTAKWSLQFVGDVSDSIDPQPSHRTPPIDETGVPYISMRDCNYQKQIIDFENARKVGRNVLEEQRQRYKLREGDFIIGKIGTIGNPIFVPARDDYTLSANIVLIQPNLGKVSPYFLKHSFESAYVSRQFEEAKNSTTQAAYGIQKVRKIKIMNPPITKQKEFEAFVQQSDKLKIKMQQSVEKLETLKAALMQEYFGE